MPNHAYGHKAGYSGGGQLSCLHVIRDGQKQRRTAALYERAMLQHLASHVLLVAPGGTLTRVERALEAACAVRHSCAVPANHHPSCPFMQPCLLLHTVADARA